MANVGRLSRARDFRRVLSEGSRARSDGITAMVAPREGAGCRLGLAVGAPVGPAVVRNRLRRRLREIARRHAPDGVDLVLRAAPPAAALTFVELENHVAAALTRASEGVRG